MEAVLNSTKRREEGDEAKGSSATELLKVGQTLEQEARAEVASLSLELCETCLRRALSN